MDTKWKKSKGLLGFFAWFGWIGFLILAVLSFAPAAISSYHLGMDAVRTQDYQLTQDFRDGVTYYLEEFLQSASEVNGYESISGRFHESVMEDRNILYTVAVKDEILYTNAEGLGLYTENFIPPEGYNFILFFNGERVHVIKDGVEQDIYGNGVYQDGGWYVPGYFNYPTEEAFRDVRICLVAVRDPQIVMIRDGGMYYSNDWYWVRERVSQPYVWMRSGAYLLGVAAICLVFAILFRRERKMVCEQVSVLTGRIFLEVKIILYLPVFAFLAYVLLEWLYYIDGYWQWNFVIDFSYVVGGAVLFLIYSFLWLIVNEWKYQKNIWSRSGVAAIARLLDLSDYKLPFGRKILRHHFQVLGIQWAIIVCFMILIIFVSGGYILTEEAYIPGILLIMVAAALTAVQINIIKKDKRMAEGVEELSDKIREIHDGGLAQNIELSADTGLAKTGDYLKDIGMGMNAAIEEKVRSERMKVELIANVSHDIKTPLTSIISYVELMKQEELSDQVREYVEILENKSQRLKTMVQDVFEVSKAASGQLPVKKEKLDFCKLLRQTMADMQEELQAADIILKEQIPEGPVFFMADGGRMYRVFQNLLQNTIHYSLEGSRVYIRIECSDGWANACIKNISKEELEQDVDYTERFVRGDVSRTKTGSGLGLSIARSFTEACGGTLKVEAIADLFVVTVRFAQES